MYFLDKLERAFGRCAIAHLALYLVIGQAFVLLAVLLGKLEIVQLILVPGLVLEGEWWRVVTFLFVPPPPGMFGYIFTAFALYIFYLMGSALEGAWGAFRFNLYLLLGVGLTVGLGFLQPFSVVSNAFIAGSVFLAFAYLNPNFELLLFFILPVKIKWLALLTWILYAVSFVSGSWSVRLQILASVGNFLIFFTPDMMRGLKQRKRTHVREVERREAEAQPRHRCHVCGKTDRTDPQMDFRYCSRCAGDECYCTEHIGNHVHVTTPSEKKA